MAALALQVWSGVHSDSAPVLTLREARSLSPAQLSQRLMGEGHRNFREARAYEIALHGPGLAGVELASAPRASLYPGLCEADAVGFGFEGRSPTAGPPEDRPSQMAAEYSERVYKVVGDTTPRPGTMTPSSRRALAELCLRSGPVLPPSDRDSLAGFFVHASFEMVGFSEPIHAWFAAHALQMAIKGAQSGHGPAISCGEAASRPGDDVCADPRGRLAALSLDGMISLGAEPCERPGRNYCAVATFQRGDDTRYLLDVRIETNAPEPSSPPREFAITRISIAGRSFVN